MSWKAAIAVFAAVVLIAGCYVVFYTTKIAKAPQGYSGAGETADAQPSGWNDYSGTALSIRFKYPSSAGWLPAKYDLFKIYKGVYGDTDEISARTINVGEDVDQHLIERAVINDATYNPSGLHPKSIRELAKVKIGNHEYHKVRTTRFEGVLSYSYYLTDLVLQKPPVPGTSFRLIVFSFTSRGVDWTNPNLDEENDPNHLTLKEILKTVRINEEM
jgi:hypothetical protein